MGHRETRSRRDFLKTTTASASYMMLSALACKRERSSKPPNIVVFITDQQSATMMSCTGNAFVNTPAMAAVMPIAGAAVLVVFVGLFLLIPAALTRYRNGRAARAGRDLIETYGVQIDQEIHQQVLDRSAPLNIPPYGGFINPKLTPVMNEAGEIIDVTVSYPTDFVQQMLEYGRDHSFLPDYN